MRRKPARGGPEGPFQGCQAPAQQDLVRNAEVACGRNGTSTTSPCRLICILDATGSPWHFTRWRRHSDCPPSMSSTSPTTGSYCGRGRSRGKHDENFLWVAGAQQRTPARSENMRTVWICRIGILCHQFGANAERGRRNAQNCEWRLSELRKRVSRLGLRPGPEQQRLWS